MSKLNFNPDFAGENRRILTIDEVREMYSPPRTLGASEDVRLAMDSALADGGVYSLLQHTLELGQGVLPQFLGYGVLQNIAQNGLIRACIGTVSDDMTRAWIELQREGEDFDKEDTIITDIMAELDKLKLQRVLHEAVELAGYEGGAFVFIDTGAEGEELEAPLNKTAYSAELAKGRRLKFVAVDPVNVFPAEYNAANPLRDDYYKPSSWWVLGQKVHSSRLLRIVGNEVPVLLKPAYNFLGIPQAQILWDYVIHFQECRAAEARLITKFSLLVFKTKLLDDVLFSSGATTQLDARMKYAQQNMSNDGILVVDMESEDLVKLETPLGGVTDIVRQALEFLAAINRTPAVKLLGISPSGFNATGESDIRNYYDHVASMQEKMLREQLKTILDCVQLHLRGKIDDTITFIFKPLGEEDKSALISRQKSKADTIAVYLDRDIISAEEARKTIADDPESGFTNIDPDDVPEPKEGQEGGGMPGMPQGMPQQGGKAEGQPQADEELGEGLDLYVTNRGNNGIYIDAPLSKPEGNDYFVTERGNSGLFITEGTQPEQDAEEAHEGYLVTERGSNDVFLGEKEQPKPQNNEEYVMTPRGSSDVFVSKQK